MQDVGKLFDNVSVFLRKRYFYSSPSLWRLAMLQMDLPSASNHGAYRFLARSQFSRNIFLHCTVDQYTPKRINVLLFKIS